MDTLELEQKAIQLCDQIAQQRFIYQGSVSSWINKIGTFSVAYDENCCGATQNVLIRFSGQSDSILLTPIAFFDFYSDCHSVD